MSKSARKLLVEPKVVRVANFHRISPDLGVISYLDEKNEHIDDLYNLHAGTDVLDEVKAGKQVDATIAPDSSADLDGHPECTAALIVE